MMFSFFIFTYLVRTGQAQQGRWGDWFIAPNTLFASRAPHHNFRLFIFIFKESVHEIFLYLKKVFTKYFYNSRKCSRNIFIFQQSVHCLKLIVNKGIESLPLTLIVYFQYLCNPMFTRDN